MSDVICGENFNTLKKGPHWTELKAPTSPIEPPLEFQDRPASPDFDLFYTRLTKEILEMALSDLHDFWIEKKNNCIQEQTQQIHSSSPPPLPSRTTNYNPPPLPDFFNYSSTLSKSSSYLSRVSPYRSQSMCYSTQRRRLPSPTSSFANSASNFASSASPYVTHTPRPSSRSSLGGSSRLSSSHNSLTVPHTRRVDDSSFITQAVSHDTLSSNQISDLYNVPFDSDMYTVPIDVVQKPSVKPKKGGAYSSLGLGGNKKRRKHLTLLNREGDRVNGCERRSYQKNAVLSGRSSVGRTEQTIWYETKRHSVAGTSATTGNEPIHMSLQEVRNYLQTLYSSSSDSSEPIESNYRKRTSNCTNGAFVINNNNNNINNNNKYHSRSIGCLGNNQITNRPKKSTFLKNIKNKKVKDSCENAKTLTISPIKREERKRRLFNFKQVLCSIFGFKKYFSVEEKSDKCEAEKISYDVGNGNVEETKNSLSSRALPPLPYKKKDKKNSVEQPSDFSTSLQMVKDYGWYWGPISGEAAEKLLSNEPEGSFIVRDSSDDHYIFSLTFKLNNSIRHVRIDHDQGNFSFGNCTKFKSQTIVEFIENAVEHSRSGRYLFFLHRRPVIGPIRVQLLHPVSRFKQVQSLQHMCRFVIHKNVRLDLIPMLPLPRRMIDYLNTPHYYAEHFVDVADSGGDDNAPSSGDNTLRSGFAPPIPSGGPASNPPAANQGPLRGDANEYMVFNF
ncbi:probable serine/threonine-protein kinase DDB_G0278845 [Sitophilus oryzae]|uniref:Probable serine/threonine-protein kinase DDB_G0278845 n=1 Tax=Sitophilus oryzae TaxID=7048 RepID=A0A6J2YSE7_SITOR|nr:probable serine/threonine-protein kinase DDB_G0278845 [Sitophilus oryzae]